MIVPANSAPPIQGSGGWFWYFPWIWRISKKFVPAEWISIRYLSAVGVGVGTVVTFRSRGPCKWVVSLGLELRFGVWGLAVGTLTYSLTWTARILTVVRMYIGIEVISSELLE